MMKNGGPDEVLTVVQWTTGNVARQSLRTIVDRPDLELIGLYAHSPDKVGKDAGELAGLGRQLGIHALGDIDEVIALRPDCIAYMPLFPDLDHLERLLCAGINVVTTSELLTGRAHGPDVRERLEAAGRTGGASLFGSGVNPGWVECLAAVASAPVGAIDTVRILESFDLSLLTGEANQDDFGWGRPAGDPGHAEDIERAIFEFEDAADLLAELLGTPLDDLRCEVRFAHALRDLGVPGRDVRAGTVAGIESSWFGSSGGREVFELATRWTIARELDQPWEVLNGYVIDVRGESSVSLRLDLVPGPNTRSIEDIVAFGHLVTALPAVNAIPAVVAARPGVVTYADLPPLSAPVRRHSTEEDWR
jgi:hypothetical protein